MLAMVLRNAKWEVDGWLAWCAHDMGVNRFPLFSERKALQARILATGRGAFCQHMSNYCLLKKPATSLKQKLAAVLKRHSARQGKASASMKVAVRNVAAKLGCSKKLRHAPFCLQMSSLL